MSVRTDFISTSVFEILQEGVAAAECIQQEGVDTYPILGYLLQSVFLRMTGYEEQKLRNICWEVATIDLDYRYQMIQGRVSYGEYSSLEDKKKVYDLLREKTRAFGADFALDTKKVVMLDEVKTEMETVMKDSLISNSFPADYHQYGVLLSLGRKNILQVEANYWEERLKKYMRPCINKETDVPIIHCLTSKIPLLLLRCKIAR